MKKQMLSVLERNKVVIRNTHHSSSRRVGVRDIVVGGHSASLYSGLQISGMTSEAGGFTLIELLVVVLIIGILAAVALPQYQKAVEKSKAAQALTMLKSVYNAAEAYVLTNGEWPTSLDELALDIDWTGTTATTNSASSEIKSNDEWSFRLQGSFASAASVSMTRISGKYAGAGFLLVNKYVDATLPTGTLLCHEQFSGPFTIEVAGTYCEKIFKGKFLRQGAEQRYYSMP